MIHYTILLHLCMPGQFQYSGSRNSFMDIEEPYFWTSTISEWKKLLADDAFKSIIIHCLQWLCQQNLVAVYGFVIMPNHVHLLWEQLKMNGKEYPKSSFEKFTAHEFQRALRKQNKEMLQPFAVSSIDRNYSFWQRDPLAIPIKSREMAAQKL